MAITISNVRLSYCNLFQPQQKQGQEKPKYSVTILLPKTNTAAKSQIDQAIAQAIEQGLVYPIAVRESIPDRAVCLIEDASHPQSIAIRAFKKLLCAEKPEAETPPAATRPG